MKVNSLVRLDKFLDIKISNVDDEHTTVLHYAVMDHKVAVDWLELVDAGIENAVEISQNYRRYRTAQEVCDLFDKFIQLIKSINETYDINLEEPISLDELDDEILNSLHRKFEEYGDRIKTLVSTNKFDKDLHKKFLQLNDLIHIMQFIKKKTKKPLRRCTIDFLPTGKHLELTRNDYMLFVSDTQWGWLYLGYNTLGKPWISVALDDDLSAVIENKVKPQKRFAAEFTINFDQQFLSHSMKMYLYKWCALNNIQEITNKESIDELALGVIPLAVLIGYTKDGESHLSISIDKDKFNTDIWDKCDIIKSVEIVDKNLANKKMLAYINSLLDPFQR